MAAINDTRIREILTTSPTIAVLGIHHEPEKAAFYVPEYLHDEGYKIVGVNPRFTDQTLFGSPVRATLAEIDEPIDLVDVFRRAEDIPGHVEDILAMKPRPKVVWFQLGIWSGRRNTSTRSTGSPISASVARTRSPNIAASANRGFTPRIRYP